MLLCLWCKGGCSTATVAAALTFFPPRPPCYTVSGMPSQSFDESPSPRGDESTAVCSFLVSTATATAAAVADCKVQEVVVVVA